MAEINKHIEVTVQLAALWVSILLFAVLYAQWVAGMQVAFWDPFRLAFLMLIVLGGLLLTYRTLYRNYQTEDFERSQRYQRAWYALSQLDTDDLDDLRAALDDDPTTLEDLLNIETEKRKRGQ